MSGESKATERTNAAGVTLDLEGLEAAGERGRAATVFRYRRPEQLTTKRGIAPLARSDILFSAVCSALSRTLHVLSSTTSAICSEAARV